MMPNVPLRDLVRQHRKAQRAGAEAGYAPDRHPPAQKIARLLAREWPERSYDDHLKAAVRTVEDYTVEMAEPPCTEEILKLAHGS